MKSKASLALMEQLVMLLVFALAAALCVSAFLEADQVSRETLRQDRAVALAQTGAETLKAWGGDPGQAAAHMDTQVDGLYLIFSPQPSAVPGLGCAEITVYDSETGERVFSLTAAWQEVGG